MLSQTVSIPQIPRETARLAKAVFGCRNFYIQVGERLESILGNTQLNSFDEAGNKTQTPQAILALITFFQFVEGLTDNQVMEALRTRIDWKFALHTPVHAPTFPQAELYKFRQMLLQEPVYRREFQKLVDQLMVLNPPVSVTNQGFEYTGIHATICAMNQMAWAQESIAQIIETLALKFPTWLRQVALPHWYGRYKQPLTRFDPSTSQQQQGLFLKEIVSDIHHLLEQTRRSAHPEILELEELKKLERVWAQQVENWQSPSNNESDNFKLNNCAACIQQAG